MKDTFIVLEIENYGNFKFLILVILKFLKIISEFIPDEAIIIGWSKLYSSICSSL